jgi:hypothetical protein
MAPDSFSPPKRVHLTGHPQSVQQSLTDFSTIYRLFYPYSIFYTIIFFFVLSHLAKWFSSHFGAVKA